MNHNKSRGTIAMVAVGLLTIAMFILVDMLGHTISGAEYLYGMSFAIMAGLVSLAVLLFTWNVVTYKRR